MPIDTVYSVTSEFLAAYKKWIVANPEMLRNIESTMKLLSYVTAGRFYDSSLVSELMYSIPNLLVLFNDILMYSGKYMHLKLPQFESEIQIWLSILEYTDVLFEVSAKKLWGEMGRWLLIAFIQTLKSTMRLLSIYLYNERITKSLPITPLSREMLDETLNDDTVLKQGFVLKRSGTIVRRIKASEPVHMRTWTAPDFYENEKFNVPGKSKKSIVLAETLYVIKPLIHLGCIHVTGQKHWQPWFVSFIIDIVSLKLFSTDIKSTSLTREEKEEIFRRRLGLILYLLRSPFYDKYSRAKIYALLNILAKSVPLARSVIKAIEKYLPHWQNTYFYTWSR